MPPSSLSERRETAGPARRRPPADRDHAGARAAPGRARCAVVRDPGSGSGAGAARTRSRAGTPRPRSRDRRVRRTDRRGRPRARDERRGLDSPRGLEHHRHHSPGRRPGRRGGELGRQGRSRSSSSSTPVCGPRAWRTGARTRASADACSPTAARGAPPSGIASNGSRSSPRASWRCSPRSQTERGWARSPHGPFVSVATVRSQVSAIREKLGVASQLEAAALYRASR